MFCFSACSVLSGVAQTTTYSPYSRYGIGEINQKTNAHIMGAGGAFIALQPDTFMPILINQANPAALAHIRLATLDLGGVADYRTFGTTSGNITKRTVNFNYAMLGFPVRKNGGACFGIMPYSSVGYNMESKANVAGVDGSVTYQYQGEGGINKAFLGYGVLPFKNALSNYYTAINASKGSDHPMQFSKGKEAVNKLLANLSLGATANYLFGTLEQSTRILYPVGPGGTLIYNSSQRQRDINVQGVSGQLGLQTAFFIDSVNYRDSSGILHKRALMDKVKFSAGYFMSLNNSVNLTYDALIYNYYSTTLGNQIILDTVLNNTGQKSTMRLPLEQGVGIGFKKGDKWHILADAAITNWNNFKLIDPLKELKNAYRLSFGVHYIPDRGAAGAGAYLKRVQYRAGAFYNTGYIELKNTTINRMAGTLGLGFPVGIGRRSSIINVGAEYGEVGTNTNNLLKEQYWRLNIGFTFNAFEDRWFRKVRYD